MWLMHLLFTPSELSGPSGQWDRCARARALSALCSSALPGGNAEGDGEGRLARLRGLGWATVRSAPVEPVDDAR